MLEKTKAQGSIEYLLLIGGVVLVAAIVIVTLTGMAQTGKGAAEKSFGMYEGFATLLMAPECSDLIDNDGDGYTDYGPDPNAGDEQCISANDDSEAE